MRVIMKSFKLYISTLILLGGYCISNAQEPDLTKEITIETEFVPIEQKATKLNILPQIAKTTISSKSLTYSEWSGLVDIPNRINTLEPYGFNTKYTFSQAKGYFDLGAGTKLNVLGNAGYKFIDNKNMQLNAWLQHISTWKGKNSSPLAVSDSRKQKINDNVFAVNFSNKFTAGLLNLGAYFHLDKYDYYGVNDYSVYDKADKQTASEFGIKAEWKQPIKDENDLQFASRLSFNHFGYSKNLNNEGNGLTENNIHAKVFSEANFDTFSLGINATADYLGYSNVTIDSITDENDWMGLLKVSPYILYKSGKLQFMGGINVDLSAQDGSKIRLSPNIKTYYSIKNAISAYIILSGGKKLNTLSEIHSICRYIAPNQIIGSTYQPYNMRLGVEVGPLNGLYFKPFFEIGSFKDQFTPFYNRDSFSDGIIKEIVSPYIFMQRYDIKGWNVGAELGYQYNNSAGVNAKIQYAPQDNDKGYVLGLDRPELVVNANIQVRPIKALSISLGYELHKGRAYYNRYFVPGPPPVTTWHKTELENINNLSLNANYQVTDKLGVFVNANNLLNKQWDDFLGMGAQKISAIAGINLVF